jgi:hypothetical protein
LETEISRIRSKLVEGRRKIKRTGAEGVCSRSSKKRLYSMFIHGSKNTYPNDDSELARYYALNDVFEYPFSGLSHSHKKVCPKDVREGDHNGRGRKGGQQD